MTIEELYDLFDDNYTVLNTHGHYTDTDECKAVEMVLDVIGELKAHREAWDRIKQAVKDIDPEDYEYTGIYCANNGTRSMKYEILGLIEECRPKEGDIE